ncbi:MAG: ATP synthase F1 subunit delta [Vicinamibacterales bacterium]
MTHRTAAARYARALLDVALKEQADLTLLDTQLAEFAALVQQHEPLRHALLSPVVPVPRKRAAVDALAARAGVLPILARTLALLAERDRLVLLPDLVDAVRQRVLDLQHVVRAEVTTAQALAPERLHQVEQSLAQVTGRRVELRAQVDPTIVGGMVARVGSTVFDASVAGHLQRIRQRLEASI